MVRALELQYVFIEYLSFRNLFRSFVKFIFAFICHFNFDSELRAIPDRKAFAEWRTQYDFHSSPIYTWPYFFVVSQIVSRQIIHFVAAENGVCSVRRRMNTGGRNDPGQ